jgi:hypothetical protein
MSISSAAFRSMVLDALGASASSVRANLAEQGRPRVPPPHEPSVNSASSCTVTQRFETYAMYPVLQLMAAMTIASSLRRLFVAVVTPLPGAHNCLRAAGTRHRLIGRVNVTGEWPIGRRSV